jgi:chorismate mutase / prephenate dehydratase
MSPTNLNELRTEIDGIDGKLVELLNQRARCAQEIGRYKQQNQKAVYEPTREEAVMANIARCNQGPLPHEDLVTIYTAILAAMRRLQSPDLLEKP